MAKTRQKRRPRHEIYVFAGLSIVSFLCLLFSTRSFIIDFQDAGFSVFSGLRIGVVSVTSFVKRTAYAVRELARLREDYAELTERMERFQALERNAAEIRQENYRLREQLGFLPPPLYRHIAAEITGRDPDNLYQVFTVNKGKKHGVEINMCVIAYQNGLQALVGVVVQAGFIESQVMPVYNDNAYVAARFTQSRYEGLVEGQGNLEMPLRMRSVSKRALNEIGEGDMVVTSGLGGVYPAGITIGRVNNLFYEDDLTSMEIGLVPAIDFSRLEYVFILSPESVDAGGSGD